MADEREQGLEWQGGGLDLPAGLHAAVVQRAYSLKGDKRGYAKYTWAVAALMVLNLGEKQFREVVRLAAGELDVGDLDAASKRVRALFRPAVAARAREAMERVERSLRKQESGPSHTQSEAL